MEALSQTITSPPAMKPLSPSLDDIKIRVKSGHTTVGEALDAAKVRFVERNKESLLLHEEAVKSLPGGNTRSLLHTAPFPVFLKSGDGYQVVSEDGHTYALDPSSFFFGLWSCFRIVVTCHAISPGYLSLLDIIRC